MWPQHSCGNGCMYDKREAREECARRGIDPDELCADGGVEAWMVVAKELEQERKRGESNRTA